MINRVKIVALAIAEQWWRILIGMGVALLMVFVYEFAVIAWLESRIVVDGVYRPSREYVDWVLFFIFGIAIVEAAVWGGIAGYLWGRRKKRF